MHFRWHPSPHPLPSLLALRHSSPSSKAGPSEAAKISFCGAQECWTGTVNQNRNHSASWRANLIDGPHQALEVIAIFCQAPQQVRHVFIQLRLRGGVLRLVYSRIRRIRPDTALPELLPKSPSG